MSEQGIRQGGGSTGVGFAAAGGAGDLSSAVALEPRDLQEGEIPILDFTDYFGGKSGALEELSRQLTWALENVGFYFLKGATEGVARLPGMFDCAERLHSLPEEKLRAIDTNHDKQHMGYLFSNASAVEQGDDLEVTKGPLKPGYDNDKFAALGSQRIYFISKGHGRKLEENQSILPSEADLPGFYKTTEDFFGVMERLSLRILPVYAHALGLPEEELLERFKDPRHLVTLNRYPPRPKDRDSWTDIPSHADCTFFTLLAQGEVPGLQIMLPSGEWGKAPVVEGCFLVNTGEFLKRLTNGRWLNTVHKVVKPFDKDRYSVVFFLTQDKRFPMSVLPRFCSKENPPLFEPFTHLSFFTSGETPYTVGARELERRRGLLEHPGPSSKL